MALRIDASDLINRRYLSVDSRGVTFCDSPVSAGEQLFPFVEIDAILLSSTGLLSYQAGDKVFKIQTRTADAEHQHVIHALVDYVAKANDAAASEAAADEVNSVNNS